jgi:uncharacterized repeat protein (TIGR03803 family)
MKEFIGFAACATMALLSSAAGAATETILYNFPAHSDPLARVEQLKSGALHGTTYSGHKLGTVFEATERQGAWRVRTILEFTGADGKNPIAGVSHDPNNVLWGVAKFGGSHSDGTIFTLTPNGSQWTENVLYNFSGGADGKWPVGNISRDTVTGALFGSTTNGGSNDCGTVFQVAPDNTVSTLYGFKGGSDGCSPQTPVHPGAQEGTLLGTTTNGGSSNAGTIFELTELNGVWTETVLYTFTNGIDGGLPADISIDRDGNIEGVTTSGGANGLGVVFKLAQTAKKWRETVLYNFRGGASDGATPVGITPSTKAKTFYVTTQSGGDHNQGTVVKLVESASQWHETLLHSFGDAASDGLSPRSRVNQDPQSGVLYGTTSAGGTLGGGTLYLISE